MSKVSLIIKREYTTRVKNKTFLIMTILGPILFASLMVGPVVLMKMDKEEDKKIAVLDSTYSYYNALPETKHLEFEFLPGQKLEELKKTYKKDGYYGILSIPHNLSYNSGVVQLYSDKQAPLSLTMHVSNALEKALQSDKLKTYEIENLEKILKEVKTNVNVKTIILEEDGEEKAGSAEIAMVVGAVSGILIYFFIFMFGTQVMRGVMEEKTNRIVEVIISSVKPFQLMMGKVVGVALVGLTQFVLWIILTLVFVTVAQSFLIEPGEMMPSQVQAQSLFESGSALTGSTLNDAQPVISEDTQKIMEIFNNIFQVNWGLMLGMFLFFFLGGYLLYGALFAAIGSAVDNEADTQQFMPIVTIPLILAIIMIQSVIKNPDGPIAYWFSIIPFTSPVVMMMRIPFGVPTVDIILSIVLLIGAFVGAIWLAGKIYRTGILMYGKKITYKELWKWIKYNN